MCRHTPASQTKSTPQKQPPRYKPNTPQASSNSPYSTTPKPHKTAAKPPRCSTKQLLPAPEKRS